MAICKLKIGRIPTVVPNAEPDPYSDGFPGSINDDEDGEDEPTE